MEITQGPVLIQVDYVMISHLWKHGLAVHFRNFHQSYRVPGTLPVLKKYESYNIKKGFPQSHVDRVANDL